METFESLLEKARSSVESYVRYRMPSWVDCDDILQEIYLRALMKFDSLRSHESFKPWILGIARNICNDFFRIRAKVCDIPLDAVANRIFTRGVMGISQTTPVYDTLDRLSQTEREILKLAYFHELSQRDISTRLGIPIGTVKSRLHNARQSFRATYIHEMKGDFTMSENKSYETRLPEYLPEYKIEPMSEPPFEVSCEELPGWVIIPRLGNKLSWGLYDMPSRRRTEFTELAVVGRAQLHGIDGVEIKAVQYDAEDYYRTGSVNELERRFIAQLTDTHVRFLAESHEEDGIRKLFTFLDGAPFLDNWGYGRDNIGMPTQLKQSGILKREGNIITGAMKPEAPDVVGRYRVTIGDKAYDTICLVDAQCFCDSIASEQFIDREGRTVLWRRFNRDDWAYERYGALWTKILPENERLIINGETYVHWYDCVTDYVL